jgi:hypothetical protein
VEATARKTAGRVREREAGAAANAIVSEFGEEELRLLPFCGGKVANCSAAGTTLIASADEWVGDGGRGGESGSRLVRAMVKGSCSFAPQWCLVR